MSTVREGDRISNYLLVARVGAGSFGEVWRARHHVFGDEVAIKVPTDPQYVRNLQREGAAVHGLKHPNIVRAVDMDPYATPPYLVMEFVSGPSLREVIQHYGGRIPIALAATILRGVCQALSAAHGAGVIHRDIKPENVLLNRALDQIESATEADVKVTDFGLGKVGGATAQMMMQSGSLLTEDGKSISGTLAYMAPEQKDGAEPTPQADIYSVGIVLFELLTGERPQGGDLPSSIRTDAPSWLDEVFRRCYTRVDRRYASADDVLRFIAPFARPRTAPAPAPKGRAFPIDSDVGFGRGGGCLVDHPRGARTDEGGRRTPPPIPNGNTCPSCMTTVMGQDQFCIGCGYQLVESVPRCPACQAYVHRNDRFCIFCGKDLRILVE